MNSMIKGSTEIGVPSSSSGMILYSVSWLATIALRLHSVALDLTFGRRREWRKNGNGGSHGK